MRLSVTRPLDPFLFCTCKRVGSGNNCDLILGSAYTHYGTCIGCCMGVGWVGIMVGMPGWFRSPASSGRRVVRVSSFSWAGRRAGLAWGGCSAWGRERKERENGTAYHSTNLKSYCLTCCTVIGGCSCSVGDLKLEGWRGGRGREEWKRGRRGGDRMKTVKLHAWSTYHNRRLGNFTLKIICVKNARVVKISWFHLIRGNF